MEPRLKTSTQWSPFPAELCEMAVAALTERFSEDYDLEGAHFVVEGRIYQQEILGRYGLRKGGQLKQQNFELSFEYDFEKEKPLEKIQTSMNVIEHLWTELFEDDLEDGELDMSWQIMPFEKVQYFYKYSTINSSLEEEADRLLEKFEKKLVYQSEGHKDSEASESNDTETVH